MLIDLPTRVFLLRYRQAWTFSIQGGARCPDTRPLLPYWRPEIRGTVGWENLYLYEVGTTTYSITGAHLYGQQGRVSHPRGSPLPALLIPHVAACMTCSIGEAQINVPGMKSQRNENKSTKIKGNKIKP